MRQIPAFVLVLTLGLLSAGLPSAPPGVYRSAAQYRLRQPAPAGQVRVSEKRNSLAVMNSNGHSSRKTLVPLDSAWGYVNGKGRTYRLVRGEEYLLEQADTLSIYSSISTPSASSTTSLGGASTTNKVYTTRRYFFSRGLSGLVFPLTAKNLKLSYEASSPAFVAAVQNATSNLGQHLTDYDEATDSYRVVTLYRQALGK